MDALEKRKLSWKILLDSLGVQQVAYSLYQPRCPKLMGSLSRFKEFFLKGGLSGNTTLSEKRDLPYTNEEFRTLHGKPKHNSEHGI
jgi:hypothetical protein